MNYETVKMFGMEREEVSAYSGLQLDYQKKFIQFRITLSTLNFSQVAIQTLGLGGAIMLAAYAAVYGRLSPGDFVLVNTYVMQLFQPLFVRHRKTVHILPKMLSLRPFSFPFLARASPTAARRMLLTPLALPLCFTVPRLDVPPNHTVRYRPREVRALVP